MIDEFVPNHLYQAFTKDIQLRTGALYEFLWVDTYNFIGWHDEEDIDSYAVEKEFQSTVGYFIKNLERWVIIGMHHNPNHELGFSQWGNIVYIPRESIVKYFDILKDIHGSITETEQAENA